MAAALACLLFVLPSTASAVDRYAEPGGNGPAPECPSSDPCSIESALASAASGDIVRAAQGTYALGPNALAVNQGVQLIGMSQGGGKPTITSSASPALQATGDGSVATGIQNFRLEHTGTAQALRLTGAYAMVMDVRTSGATACEVASSSLYSSFCINTNGARAVLAYSSQLQGCCGSAYLEHVTAVAQAPGSVGIAATNGAGYTEIGVLNSIASGVSFDVSNAGQNKILLFASNFDSTNEPFGGDGPCESAATTFDFSPCITDPSEEENQSAPPTFENPAGGNFHQASTSVTIEAGSTEYEPATTLDVDSQDRVQGAWPDIGADEFAYPDTDGDGLEDPLDATCPASPAGQDPDGDGCVNSEDADDDDDNVPDTSDNCVVSDPQALGGDFDNDGCRDGEDADDDGDGAADAADQCAQSPPGAGADPDGDGCRNSEDADDDNDTVADGTDNCPVNANTNQLNTDGDGQGNACDGDDDNDGRNDGADACPAGAQSGIDTDADGCFNSEDADDDGDSVPDDGDDCPVGAGSGPDPDGDGCVNGEDSDDDGDGVGDGVDSCVLEPGPVSNGGCPDEDPPSVTFNEAPKKKTTKRSAKFRWEADEVSTFECKLDNKAYQSCDGSFSVKVKPGKHSFTVRATDQADNEGTATHRWTVKKG